MVSGPDDKIKQLIESAKSGDQNAITRLYQMHIDQIYRYIAYRVPGSDAEDVTAEVFVRMVEGLPHFEYTGAPFESWLYRIAAARVADFHRKHHKRYEEEIPETFSDDATEPEQKLVREQEISKLRTALQELHQDEQTIILMRFVERKSHKEVASVIGKSVAAVRTMQHRALVRLATLLDADGKERHYLRGKKEPECKS